MTSNEASETKRNVYDACDPQYLRQLREAAGLDHLALARTACLSVAQVRQLETEDSDSLFYSDAIKRQAYKRLLMILGAEPPMVEVPQELRDPAKVAQAHLNTLDQIVAMSHQPVINRSTFDVLTTGLEKVKEHQQVMAALLLLGGAIGLFVWNGLQNSAELSPASNASVSAAAVEVAPEPVTVASAPLLTSSVPVAAPVDTPAASAPAAVAVSPAASMPAIAMPTAPLASAAALGSVTALKVGGCAYSNDAMPQVTSLFAKKEGRYVYFVSTVDTEVCVVDGNKQATLLQLKTGENRSVYGVSPWQLSGVGLQKAQIYFQGGRISLPDTHGTRFKLVEVPVAP
jgi:Helix-turn-helix domain